MARQNLCGKPAEQRRFGYEVAYTLIVGIVLVFLSGTTRAAMNFCAAPALQSNEILHEESGVRALVKSVGAHLDAQPQAIARLPAYTPAASQPGQDQRAALQDMELMRDAALAWRVTGDKRYLQLADRLLFAWTATYQPNGDLRDETRFEGLILAYDLTASALPVKTRNQATAFITRLGSNYAAPSDAVFRALANAGRSDWQSHRIKLVTLAAFTLGNRTMMNTAQRLFIAYIGSVIKPDGTPVDFVQPEGLGSVVDDLQPLVTAALAARRAHRFWLRQRSANGASLAAALDWLALTTRNAKPQAATRDAPTVLATPHGASLATVPSAAVLFYLAARLDGRYARVSRQLSSTPPTWLAICLPLPAR